MDKLKRLLGMDADTKWAYHISENEIDRDEFQYSQALSKLLFDEEIGLIATLGAVWNAVNDPRFLLIENCFIHNRRAIFGGDSSVGIQHISDNIRDEKDSQSLEQYSTILGEGRHFRKAMLDTQFADEDGDLCHPKTFHMDSEDTMWRLIKQECPNYFTKTGKPNKEAIQLLALFKADLIGLIDDYAELSQVDVMVNAESGEIYEEAEWDGETPIVNMEISQLEQALTVRARLRLTAYTILVRLGFEDKLSGDFQLTDWERDELLKIVYTSEWPEKRTELALKVMTFVMNANVRPYADRIREQEFIAKRQSQRMIQEIKDGTRIVLNKDTDPGVLEENIDSEAALIMGIQSNPYKRDLFVIYTEAEKRLEKVALLNQGDVAEFPERDDVALKVVELLRPVFESTNYDVNEEIFQRYVRQIRALQPKRIMKTVEGTFGEPL